MRINNLNLDKNFTDNKGLKPIQMQRIGHIVALVGRNGSGKTRILDTIQENIDSVFSISNFLNGNITEYPNSMTDIFHRLTPYLEYMKVDEELSRLSRIENPTQDENRHINTLNNKAKALVLQFPAVPPNALKTGRQMKGHEYYLELKKLAVPLINTLKEKYIIRIDNRVISNLKAFESDDKKAITSFESLLENISGNEDLFELNSLTKTSLKYLTKLPNQLTAEFADSKYNEEIFQQKKSYQNYIQLKNLFEIFLHKSLTWESRIIERAYTETDVLTKQAGIWKLEGREFKYEDLSDGEKSLLAYVLLFFLISQNKKLNIQEAIVFVDEPELHLHPDAELDLLNGIRDMVDEKGQFWFATHSINVLSDLEYQDIFMVKNGEIKHPSSSTQFEALNELMQLEHRVLKLSNFISSISDWTFVNFMTDCFKNPEAIEFTRQDDPQIHAFITELKRLTKKESNVLLDLGAGKGRLYDSIINDSSFIKTIEYTALEPNEEFRKYLTQKGVKSIYKSHEDIPVDTFDFIILCNVLHEIDIMEWENTINRIRLGLKSNGYLIIIEAKTLNKGEKIGETGFILLDYDEINILFDLKDGAISINSKNFPSHITCAVISRKEMKTIKKMNIIKTVKSLQINTFAKLERLRTDSTASNNPVRYGRQSAFLSQLYLNSIFALKKLEM